MLHFTIIHEPNKTYILEIKDMDNFKTLAQFDHATNQINLEVIKDYVGHKVLVTHFIRENNSTRVDYEHEKTVTKVEQDSNSLWFVEYA